MATEKRLIDVIRYAEELRLIIVQERQRLHNIPVMQEVIDLLEIARNMALKQPTVDAVEVVRCKDCKSYQLKYFPDGTQRMCCENSKGIWTATPPYVCCSYGERKDNGQG